MRTALLAALLTVAAPAAEPYPPLEADAGRFGAHVQGTMRRLAGSTARDRRTVRVLFYGQSITEQKWAAAVLADLRARFPHAHIVSENRALGGFSAQLLVKTAETDLYPFQPDLLIFHAYGAHTAYEDIIRRVRERTTAEILMQTDHVVRPADFTEETDPAKLPPRGDHWDAFMNHNWLPAVAREYDAELCDQRALWKRYLTANKLPPQALLSDAVHLNAHGEFLMAECVKSYLQVNRKAAADGPARVRTLHLPPDPRPVAAKRSVDFVGARVDVVFRPGADGRVTARVDGQRPTELPGTLALTRALATPGGKWPVVAGFAPGRGAVPEEWTLKLARDPANPKRFTFTAAGSVTGPDGAGATDAPFRSASGRAAIDPDHWGIDYALALAQVKPVPATLTVKWKVVSTAADEPTPPDVPDGVEAAVTVAQGLTNGPHTLELTGDVTAVAKVRVYRPTPAGR